MSFLRFDGPFFKRGQVTFYWEVRSGPILLGRVKWFPRWRQYSFFPNAQCVFEQECLREIADFVEFQTREHKEARKPAKSTEVG